MQIEQFLAIKTIPTLSARKIGMHQIAKNKSVCVTNLKIFCRSHYYQAQFVNWYGVENEITQYKAYFLVN